MFHLLTTCLLGTISLTSFKIDCFECIILYEVFEVVFGGGACGVWFLAVVSI